MKNIWKIFFIIVSVVQLAALALNMPSLVLITKPLLMPSLGLWLLSETRPARFIRGAWLAGLAFSTMGDILLMLKSEGKGEIFFILGLGAFLLAHVFYIGGLWFLLKKESGFLRSHPLWAIPFVLYLLALLGWLWPGIPKGLHLPVGAYGVVITTMALSVMQLRTHIPNAIFQIMMAGALMFVASDSLLAMGKFGGIPVGNIPIMATYIIGQALLAYGVMRLLKEPLQ